MNELVKQAEISCKRNFEKIEEIALFNQEKILDAFKKNRVGLRHFTPTTGYGYDDIGKNTLNSLFADIFRCEKAIVSPLIASGTHALTLALFGVLRPNDTLLSISGKPYDTLNSVISGENIGSLKDFNINYKQIDLKENKFDYESISKYVLENPKIIFIQRSRGYSWRNAFSIAELGEVISVIRKINTTSLIMVDNCYGEFVDILEPTEVGADIVVGSMIKNPGGGIAPTGGYICGVKTFIEQIEGRLTSPSIGNEVGSYNSSYQPFYQGLFLAPHIVSQALKGNVLFGQVFQTLGYETLPSLCDDCNDIIRSIKFKSSDELITFCQEIQRNSPIDSNVTPYPWDMPGYDNQVIMAAGTFVQGASIELSADSPIKEPYIAYLQGGLTYEHVKIALKNILIAMSIV